MKAAEVFVQDRRTDNREGWSSETGHTNRGALWVPGRRKGCLMSGDANSVIHAENKIGLTHHLIHKNNFKMEINRMKRHSGLFYDKK